MQRNKINQRNRYNMRYSLLSFKTAKRTKKLIIFDISKRKTCYILSLKYQHPLMYVYICTFVHQHYFYTQKLLTTVIATLYILLILTSSQPESCVMVAVFVMVWSTPSIITQLPDGTRLISML